MSFGQHPAPHSTRLEQSPERWIKRWRRRCAIRRELLCEPDSVLADAGLTRAEAEREAAKPFWMA